MTIPKLVVERTNTILYCEHWIDTVAFYRDTLGLTATHTTDWFVEVHLTGTAHLSLANAASATITAGHGAGLTLSWQINNLDAIHQSLSRAGIATTTPAHRWNSTYIELHDPEGTRIELWTAHT